MDIQTFLSDINENNIVLTANRRLAVYLRQQYDSFQVNKGLLAWPSLSILPLTSWLDQLWDKMGKSPRLVLTDFQELIMWEAIISESRAGKSLINVTATAQMVKDSWKLMNAWLLTIQDLDYSLLQDTQVFIGFVKAFQRKCHAYQCISQSEITLKLIASFKANVPSFIPTKIYFVGFADYSPAIQALKEQLETKAMIKDIRLSYYEKTYAVRTSFFDQETELHEMARWAYSCLLFKPQARMGCVIPNLSEKRNEVVRIFTDVFYAEGLLKKFSQPPFNTSAADPLVSYPIIHTAMRVLSITGTTLSQEDISYLLLSPFLGGSETELSARAKLETQLRLCGEKYLHLNQLVNDKLLKATCNSFWKFLKKLEEHKIDHTQIESLAFWANHYTQQLAEIGWPGERSLNSTEFQLVERFKKLMDEYIAIDRLRPKVTYHQALDILQKLVSKTLFQPKTDELLPIQLLSFLEADGIGFDYLWISHLDSETWPAPSSPNPFIPFELQRKHHMPHATPERELQFSLQLTNGFLQSAKEIIFSHPEMDGEKTLLPSALITDYPYCEVKTSKYLSIEHRMYQLKNVEQYVDERGPPLENFLATGGSAIFKSQAACPFQAFAKYRLQAKPLENLQLGLAAKERGLLLHDILAQIWNELRTHQALCSTNHQGIKELIDDKIHLTLLAMRKSKSFTLKDRLFLLEKIRLSKLLSDWLALEKKRQPFEVIECEQRKTIQIGPLSIHIQLDRLDRLEDGTYLIIDYKTGQTTYSDWFGERPNEPQLPLYSTLFNITQLSGILFAQVRPSELTFKGITALQDIVPGAITLERLKQPDINTMQALTTYWGKYLNQLANDFSQGIAKVSPKEMNTCQHCKLQMLCRVERRVS
jgi:ATP-dependent helicase/nuclease subunit B